MNINIFNIIISLITILIAYILISLVIKFLLKVFNNYEYKNYYLLLPTFFSMGSFSLGFLIWYYIITYIFNIDIIEVFISFIIKEPYIPNVMIVSSFITLFICLILQSLSILTVNIDYKKLTGNTRFAFKKLFKIREITNKNLTIKDDPDKISPITAFFISLLTFFIICIFVLILFFIGYLISRKLV